MTGFNRTIELCYEAWQYHFEFLNLGYAAYLDFFGFCKQAFPGISDLGIAKMVQGIEVDLFRPDDELRKLAKLAVEVGQDSDEWRAAYERRQGPVVQLHERQRLLQRRQGLARPPGDPARLHPRLHREAAGRRDRSTGRPPRSPPSATGSRASTARCWPTTTPAPRSTRSSGCRGSCSRTSRTTTSTSSTGRCRCSGAGSASSAQVLARRRLLAGRRRHLLRPPRRAPAGDLRLRQRVGGRDRGDRPGLLAGRDRAPPRHHRRARIKAAGARAQPAAGGHHRAVHDHALRDHDRARGPVARRAGGRLRAERHGRLAGRRRGRRARDHVRRPARRAPRRRDPRRAHHGAELGPGVRPHRRDRHRHRRHDEPRRDRLPRVRAARRDRHRLGDGDDPDAASGCAWTAPTGP